MPRPKETASTAQMLQVARLFYKDGLTKQEIATRENIDSRKVTWLLQQAKELGVVKISFQETTESGLEDRLRKKFEDLQRVLIVPGRPIQTAEQYAEFLPRCASVAATYFDELIDHHPHGKPLHVGISGGTTLYAVANMIPEKLRKHVHVHATALIGQGRFHKSPGHINPIVNASILHSRCGGLSGHINYATVSPYRLNEPGPEARKIVAKELKALAESKPISDVLREMDDLDIAFAGLGVVNPGRASSAVQTERISITGLLQPIISASDLKEEGAEADLAYCLIRSDGTSRPEWQFFLTAGYGSKYPGINFYKHMVDEGKTVIAIAGPGKLPAIKAALAAKAINIWITDEDSARQIAEGS